MYWFFSLWLILLTVTYIIGFVIANFIKIKWTTVRFWYFIKENLHCIWKGFNKDIVYIVYKTDNHYKFDAHFL